MPSFASRLLACIAERNTSQAELARHAGVSAASVSDWVRTITKADNVKAEPLLRAAAFLDVNPMWLLTGKGARHTHAATVLHVAEPAAAFRAWPFKSIDYRLVTTLEADDAKLLEGAWLLSAKQLGFSLQKPAAA